MDFKVASLNVNSIVNYGRKYLLNDFITANPAHVYFIQETKFGKDHGYSFPQFSSFTSTRAIGTGGVLMLIHCGLKVRNLRTITGSVDGVFTDICMNNTWITFGSVYVSPTCNDLGPLVNLLAGCQHFLVGGDFNARDPSFGDVSANSLGRLLLNWAINDCCIIANPIAPTCFHSMDGSFIDKFIFDGNMPCTYSAVQSVPSFSDHCGILLTIHCPAIDLTIRNGFQLRQFHKVNAVRMNRFLEERLNELLIPTEFNLMHGDLESLAASVNDILVCAANRFIPTVFIRSGGVILSGHTRAAIRACHSKQRKLHRLHQMGAWLPEILAMRGEIKLLRGMVFNAVSHDLGEHYRRRMSDTTSMRDAYRNVKLCTSHRKRKACPSVLYVNDLKNESLIGAGEIANGFLNLFSENHRLTTENVSTATGDVDRYCEELTEAEVMIKFGSGITPRIINEIELDAVNERLPATQRNVLTSAEEVNEIIQRAPPKKSTGTDQMPYCLLKLLSPAVILLFTTLFNQLLSCTYFPIAWKHSLITPIPKVGKDSSIIDNWRPISNLNCLSKIYERILARRITLHVSGLNIFPDQFGFLGGHSSIHALGRLQSAINIGLNNGQFTTFVSLDLRSAFDTVWHNALLFKMGNLRFSVFLIKTIQSFLTNRTFSVRIGDFISEMAVMPAGTPQGSVCSPILFNLYLHDIPRNDFVKNVQFADDTSIFCTTNDPVKAQCEVNLHLVRLSNYFHKWKLLLNERKTLLMIFLGFTHEANRRLRSRFQQMTISLNGLVLPIAKRLRFLGVIFDRNNRFVGHIDHALKKARSAFFALRPMLRSRLIDPAIKTNIYKAYVRPILTYASPIWARERCLSSHQMERIRSFERRILRISANVRRNIGSFRYANSTDLHKIAGCERIDRFIADKAVNFFERCATSPTGKIRALIWPNVNVNGIFTGLADFWHRSNGGGLFTNGKLLIFNKSYDGQNRPVYNVHQ